MSRKKHAEHVNHERWLVSYADFITMLFALFVVLYATANAKKTTSAGSIGQAVQQAFQELGIGGLLDPKPPRPAPHKPGQPPPKDAKSVEAMAARIREALQKQIANGAIAVRITSDGLVISLREAGFFDSGVAAPRAGTADTLATIVSELRDGTNPIRVEGHTDNIPIHTAQFASNWELSTARAANIARQMIEQNVSPERIGASGYAEYRPVADNDSADGRAQNRRVDIVVLREMSAAKLADTAKAGLDAKPNEQAEGSAEPAKLSDAHEAKPEAKPESAKTESSKAESAKPKTVATVKPGFFAALLAKVHRK